MMKQIFSLGSRISQRMRSSWLLAVSIASVLVATVVLAGLGSAPWQANRNDTQSRTTARDPLDSPTREDLASDPAEDGEMDKNETAGGEENGRKAIVAEGQPSATGDRASGSPVGGQGAAGLPNAPITEGKKCNLYLHGAGWNENVSDRYNAEGIHELQPPSPDGAFWEYDGPHNYSQAASTGEPEYQRIVEYLRNYVATNNCGPLVVRGGSNGGGLAAKLYCRSEDFGGRAWGFIFDDPVMDVAVVGCSPSPNISRTFLNHSEELRDEAASASSNDFNCEYAGWGWYCEDNTTMTLDTYVSHIGMTSVRSCSTHSGDGCTYVLSGMHMNYVFWEEY